MRCCSRIQSLVLHYLIRVYFLYGIHIQILKQKLLSLKCKIKTEQIVAIENVKLKYIKFLSSNRNAFCDSSKLFFSI